MQAVREDQQQLSDAPVVEKTPNLKPIFKGSMLLNLGAGNALRYCPKEARTGTTEAGDNM